jgi:hypothetical protein
MDRRTRNLIVAIVAAFAGVAPASASAALTWSSTAPGTPQTLSPSGTSADQVQVATDAAGDAVAVWVQNDAQDGVTRIAMATRSAGQDFKTCEQGGQQVTCDTLISPVDTDATQPSVAINSSGRVLITWDGEPTNAPGQHAPYYVTGPVGGTLSAPAQLADYDDDSADPSLGTDPQAGIDAAGDLFIATLYTFDATEQGEAYEQGNIIMFTRLATGSRFVSTTLDATPPTGGVPRTYETMIAPPTADPRVAVNPAGAVVVTWGEQYFVNNVDSPPRTYNVVESAYRAPGGAGGDPNHGGFEGTPLIVSDGSTFDQSDAQPAIDSTGNVIVVDVKHDVQGYVVLATPRSASSSPSGAYGVQVQISSSSLSASSPTVTFDASGNAYAAWLQNVDTSGSGAGQIEVAYRPATATGGPPEFGAAVAASGPDADAGPDIQDADAGPVIGVDSAGRQTVEWASRAPAVPGDDTQRDFVEAATRDGSTGSFSTPAELTPALDLDTGDGPPQLSVSASGQAVAVWHYTDADGDTIAQAAFGSLPTQTPPPPPPPPPPSVPNVIVPAEKLQAGKEIVLTADVSNASSLDWSFKGGPAHVIGDTVGGHLQNSVRLHWFDKALDVKVTVTSSSGVHTYSRSFKLPGLPTDPTSKAVIPPIKSTPRVFATGDTATLLGQTTCGAVTLYSGEQVVSGCMRPINQLSDVPAQERGVINTIAGALSLDSSNSQVMDSALQKLDGYVVVGPALLNHTWPAVPDPGANVISFPGLGVLTSSHASLNVGGVKLGGISGHGFSLHVNPGRPDIPLGSLPKPSLPDVGGFPLVGDWNIDLDSGDATIDAHLQLPDWLSIGGIPIQSPVKLRATPGGLVVDKISIGPLNVDLGPLAVNKFKITYDRPSDTWTGSGEVCVLDGACLDMSPPNGEVKIVHGALNYAGATLVFPEGSGIPLFAGVDLNKIGFGLGLDPFRLIGRAGISVLDLVELDGEFVTAFPTHDHPFVLARDEVGNDFPPEDYGVPFTEPTIGAAADVSLNLPEVGYTKLGSGYLLFEIPDYIAIGGAFNVNLVNVIQIDGGVSGAMNFRDKTLNLHAEAEACLLLIGKICAGAAVNVSRAPDDGGGAGGCIDIAGFHIGGGVLWKGTKIVVWPFDGCKWSRFAVDVKPSLASAAAASRTIVVKRGAPNPALKLFGKGAAPLVRVTGPGGQSLNSTDKGFDYSPGGHIRILRYQGNGVDFTVVGLEKAKPGTYTVTTLPGSVPFTEIDSATDPPDAKVTAKVTGTGSRRMLSYDIRNRPDQTVTFSDVNTGGAAKAIGTIHGGGKGTLRFTPAPGRGRRSIVAQFTLAGMPAERLTVAHYRPPSPQLPTPTHVRAVRHRTRLLISWRRVAGATRYDIVITDRGTGYQRLVATRGDSVVVTHIPLSVGGRVTVRATAGYRLSLAAGVSVRRLASPKNSFAQLGKCKLRKRKISCVGGPPVPKRHKKPTHH